MASSQRQDYIEHLLALYRATPGTTGGARPADRRLAAHLFDRQIPLELVELALKLAAARRQDRPRNATPLPTIRSLHYFLPVLDELCDPQLDPHYLDYLRYRLNTPHPTQDDAAPSHL